MEGRKPTKCSGLIILVSLFCFVGFTYITYAGLFDGLSVSTLKESYIALQDEASRPLKLFHNVKNTSLEKADFLERNETKSKERVDERTLAEQKDLLLTPSHWTMTTDPESRGWQACDDLGDVFVYSAHYREVEQDIRVVGIALRTEKRTVSCTFPDRSDLQDVQTSVEIIPEHHSDKSTAVFMSCSLKRFERSYKPESVGIKVGKKVTLLRVLYPKPREFNFTVCVACLFGPYKDYSRLIETIETDLMFGADHLVFYNHSISPEVDKVLQYYVDKGKIEVLPWKSPNISIHYYAQLAQIQDCILSNRGRSKYVVVKDLDELIVPHKHKTWNEMMNFLDTGRQKISTFLFRNSFFEFHWQDIIPRKPGSPKVDSLMYIWRDELILPIPDRSKAIVRPEGIEFQGIHFTWVLNPGYTNHDVDPAVAYLHHYRTQAREKSRVKDARMLDFSDILLKNINKIYMELGLKL